MFELSLEEKGFPREKIIEEVVLRRDKKALEVKKHSVYMGNGDYLSLPAMRHTMRTGK